MKLVQVSGLEAAKLGIPLKSIRGPVDASRDTAYVDARRLKRMRRRRFAFRASLLKRGRSML